MLHSSGQAVHTRGKSHAVFQGGDARQRTGRADIPPPVRPDQEERVGPALRVSNEPVAGRITLKDDTECKFSRKTDTSFIRERQQLYVFNICILSRTLSFGHCRECEVINQADEEDTLYRVATPSVSKGGKGKDFILLASRRKPCDARCGSTPHIKHLSTKQLLSLHLLSLLHPISCFKTNR